jgi:hypothetical protein
MSNVAVIRSDLASAQGAVSAMKARDYLGPATVLEASPSEVSARLPGGDLVRARLAMAFTYEPRQGDEVLVIGNDAGHYVIGVLHGTGRTALAFQGDVEVRAVDGVLSLAGDKGVRVASPDVEISAGKLSVFAGAVMQRLASLRQHVTELFSLRAGQSHQIVDGASFSQSKSATILTEEKVTINGKEIHLG